MGERGPSRTPTPILHARGSRLAASRSGEPRYPAGAPKCPAWLGRIAKAEWKRVVPMLEGQGLVTHADLAALAGYCSAVEELAEATRLIREEGRTVMVGGRWIEGQNGGGQLVGGQPQPHPAISQRRSAWAAVRQFSALFGFSPACRSRVVAQASEEPQATGKARFFKGA